MKVGEVFWVDLPARGGHAQMGRRPAIVLQTSEASSVLPTVLLIPMTTQLDALRFPGTLLVEPDLENGLKSGLRSLSCSKLPRSTSDSWALEPGTFPTRSWDKSGSRSTN